MQQMFKNAGVGSQANSANDAISDNLGSPTAQVADEPDEYGNFISYAPDETDNYNATDELTPDPRDAQLELMQSQLDKAMQIIQGFQSAPAQAPVMQQAPAAPVDFFSGYDPTDFIDRFGADPNQALVQSPAMRQQVAELNALRQEIAELRNFREEQLYYENQGIADLEERKGLKAIMKQDPGEILRKAYEFDKAERIAKAKEAEGLKGVNEVRRPDPALQARQAAAKRLAPVSGDMSSFMRNLAARQKGLR